MNSTPRERLQANDVRFLAICLGLLALTTWFSVRYFYRAFPEASIDFRVNRDQSADIAGRFLKDRGLDAAQSQHASRFSYDGEAKTFLERELGLEQANQVMGSKVRLWRWSHRWFRPQQKEEFSVDVTPKGEVVGFVHLIPEAAPRPSMEQPAARAAAEKFLGEVLGRDAAAMEFVEGASTARPARTDHTFTWQERGFEVHEARYRVEVVVLGSEIGGFREFLKIPEQWSRDYEKLRSKNEAAQTVDTALTLLLAIGLLVMIVVGVRRHNIHRRHALVVGGIGAALLFLSNWNSFPLREFGYPTTDSYASFLTQQLLQSLLSAVGAGVLLAVLTAGAEPLYREFLGRQVSLGSLFSPRGLRTRSFLRGSVLGLSLTGIFVAYQIGFYMLAYQHGAWSPADVPYDDLLNTRFPWLYVLFGGFLPAVSEEFLFRMFAIPFLKKLVRVLWVALVLAGFLWGFGHAGYPQQPFWIRGVEVGIGGVALGLVMLKWGILPTLVWHYSVDAMYSALLLARSDSLYFKLSGLASAGIMVLPAAYALFEYWRRGGFEPEEGLRNADHAAPAAAGVALHEEAAPAAVVQYTPLSLGRRLAALAAIVAAAAIAFVPVDKLGSRPRYELPEETIRAAAGRFLSELGLKADSYRVVAFPADHWAGPDSLAGKYMLERRPLARVKELLERHRPVHHWMVRYYRPLEKDEVGVSVHPETGHVLGFSHQLPETQPGDDLPPEKARELASAFAAAHGTDVGTMELKESTSKLRKARRDYTLVWEARDGNPRNVDEARYRVEVTVSGSQVTGWRGFWKIPEAFERARSERNVISIVVLVLRIAGMIALSILAVWLLVDATRKKELRWGRAIRWAVPLAALGVLGALLSLSQIYSNYDTAIPLGTFQTTMAAGLVMTAAGLVLFLSIQVALLLCIEPDGPEWLKQATRRAAGMDALLFAGLAVALAAAGLTLRSLAQSWFPALALPRVGTPEVIVSAAPALASVASAAGETLRMLATIAVIAAFVRMMGRRWLLAAAAGLVVLGGMAPSEVHTAGEFVFHYALSLVEAAVVVAVCLVVARRNLLAYMLAAWALSLGAGAAELFAQHNSRLAWHGGVVAAVLLVTVACAVYPSLAKREAATRIE